MDTTDEWITERTGIRERRWVEEGDGNTAATMGIKAAKKAIDAAGLEPNDIGHIVFATISPDYYIVCSSGISVLFNNSLPSNSFP